MQIKSQKLSAGQEQHTNTHKLALLANKNMGSKCEGGRGASLLVSPLLLNLSNGNVRSWCFPWKRRLGVRCRTVVEAANNRSRKLHVGYSSMSAQYFAGNPARLPLMVEVDFTRPKKRGSLKVKKVKPAVFSRVLVLARERNQRERGGRGGGV